MIMGEDTGAIFKFWQLGRARDSYGCSNSEMWGVGAGKEVSGGRVLGGCSDRFYF